MIIIIMIVMISRVTDSDRDNGRGLGGTAAAEVPAFSTLPEAT